MLIDPPEGCAFANRCPYRMRICRSEDPGYFAPMPGNRVACWLHDDQAAAARKAFLADEVEREPRTSSSAVYRSTSRSRAGARSRRSKASISISRGARPSAWSARAAAESRPSAARSRASTRPTAGRSLRRRGYDASRSRRAQGLRARHADDLQDPYLLPQSAHDGARADRRGPRDPQRSAPAPSAASESHEIMRLVGPGRRVHEPLPARILRRPAPAHRHRARARA